MRNMNEFNLEIGLRGKARADVTDENIATKFGSGKVNVFGTPAMIALMEEASIDAVDKYLPSDFATVGTKISVKHIAATPLGMSVTAESELIAADGRKLKFKVEVYDSKEKIGESIHSRYIIKLSDFIKKAETKLKNSDLS